MRTCDVRIITVRVFLLLCGCVDRKSLAKLMGRCYFLSMEMVHVPLTLQQKLGEAATEGLIAFVDRAQSQQEERLLYVMEDRYEKRVRFAEQASEEQWRASEQRLLKRIQNEHDARSREIKALDRKIDGVNQGLSARIHEVDRRLSDKIDQVDQALSDKIDQVDRRLTDKIDQVDRRLTDKIDNLKDTTHAGFREMFREMRVQTRWFIGSISVLALLLKLIDFLIQ